MRIREDAGIFLSSVSENAYLDYFWEVTTKSGEPSGLCTKWQVKQTFLDQIVSLVSKVHLQKSGMSSFMN